MSKTMKLPTIEELSPELAALHSQRVTLSNEAAVLRAEQFELARARPQPEPPNDAAVRVAAILGRSPPTNAMPALERLWEIDKRLADIDAALELLRAEIDARKSTASARIQEMVDPEFRERRRSLCEALIALHRADYRLRELPNDIEALGLSSGNMRQVYPYPLDDPSDQNGWVAQHLEQARRDGIISRSQIPTELAS